MTSPDPSDPSVAQAVFGERLAEARRYADLLATDGVAHGHIGPREVDRLWDRHLVNSALVTDLLPVDAAVVDVGSGAGLPGIPMAIRRPDLRVTLVEPMARRVRFLTAAVEALDLAGQVTIVRGRADDDVVRNSAARSKWVVARAVAPLDRLVEWCLPLLATDGKLLAMKGRSVQDEIDRCRTRLRQLGARVEVTQELGAESEGEPTWIVTVGRDGEAGSRRHSRRGDRRGAR